MTTIAQTLASAAKPAYIELYTLDLTPLGGDVLYFTPNVLPNGNPPSFGGQEYQPLPIAGEGWASTSDGAPPQPVLKVSNVNRFLQGFLTDYQDMVGARLTRTLTFDIYLDSGSEPNGSEIFGEQTYLVAQKTKHSRTEVTFMLVSVIDAPQCKIPRRVTTRKLFPGVGLFQASGG